METRATAKGPLTSGSPKGAVEKIVFEDVAKVFPGPAPGQEVVAVNQFNFTIFAGEFVCLLGPSGCGKTTLLNMVAGLTEPTRGRILIDGQPVSGPGPDRTVVFQDYALFPWMTVVENVAFGLESQGIPRAEREELARKLLDIVGLTSFAEAYPHTLSGGMKQRISILRALATNPDIILMDEPLAALDAFTRHELQQELLTIWEALRKTVVFITHNIEEAVFLADRIVVMAARPGRVLAVVDDPLPRPRDIRSDAYHRLTNEVRALLDSATQRTSRSDYNRLSKVLSTRRN